MGDSSHGEARWQGLLMGDYSKEKEWCQKIVGLGGVPRVISRRRRRQRNSRT